MCGMKVALEELIAAHKRWLQAHATFINPHNEHWYHVEALYYLQEYQHGKD